MAIHSPGTAGVSALLAQQGLGTLGGFTDLSPAVDRVRQRVGRAKIAIISDSTGRGWGAGQAVGPGSGNAYASGKASVLASWPTLLAAYLRTAGIPCRTDALLGTGNVAAGVNADAIALNNQCTLTLGAGWTAPVTGRYFTCSADTSSLTYKPALPADTFDIELYFNSGAATITVTDASGTLATINTDAAAQKRIVTVTRDVASTLPISIQRTGVGTNVFLCGITPYLAANPMLEIINYSQGGALASAEWINTASQSALFYSIPLVDANLYIIALGANDANGAVSAATYKAAMQTLITQCLTKGNVMLAKPHKAKGNTGSYNVPAAYLTAIDELIVSNSLPAAIDFNALSLVAGDYFESADGAVHLSAQGYATEAPLVSAGILAVL